MTTVRTRTFSAGLQRWTEWRSMRSLRKMRRLGQLAAEPRLVGTPHFEVYGSIRIGAGVTIVSQPVPTHFDVHRGAHLEIGDEVSIGSGCGVACQSHILIGAGTILGSGVLILDSDYHVAGAPEESARPLPIAIGSRVRIGENAMILRGARIEDDVEIDPGSVVSGFIAAGMRVGGVPARDLSGGAKIDHASGPEAVVLMVAQRIFRLPAKPGLNDGPDQIARWDSLGSLSFLLALEDAFAITLDVDDAAQVRSLGDAVALVRRTSERS